jgi:uncharacterized membrane protein YozB (DUF420 family)
MVANTADALRAPPTTGAFARFADRWIYVFMAAFYVVTALVGFLPDSANVLAAVEAGQRPPLSPVLHAHAIAMGAWLLLLLTQTTLVATGNTAQHRKLGMVGMVLVPTIVVLMFFVARSAFSAVLAMPPGAMPAEALAGIKRLVSNIYLEQIRSMALFGGLIAWALIVRKRDSETHKRLMILATLVPLPAAINRMTWLPGDFPNSPVSTWMYQLLWIAPVIIYDLARRGRVHRAYVIGIALNVPFVIAAYLLWNTPGWAAMVPGLMGL